MTLRLRSIKGKKSCHAGMKKIKLKPLRKKIKIIANVSESENNNNDIAQVQEYSLILDKESINTSRDILAAIGFRPYLEDSVLGLSKSSDVIAFSLLSIARFLLWTHLHIRKTALTLSNFSIRDWTSTIVNKHSSVLLGFQSYILNVLKFSPDSVISFSSCLKEYIEWFHTFRSTGDVDPFKIELTSYHKFTTTNSRIMRGARKLRSKNLKKKIGSQTNSMDEAIADRRLPQGGLKELQDVVNKEMEWVRAFSASVRRGPGLVDESTYQRLVRLLIASMYVFSPQGRVSGIQDMQVKDVPDLNASFATSRDFKTSEAYGIQAVSLGDISKEILAMYMKFFRPRVVTSRPCPNDPLFITFHGHPDLRLGRHVTDFFASRLGINITTTLIRSLVESTVEQRYRSGEITLEQREAMSVISGHSNKIAKEFYVRENVSGRLEMAKVAMGTSDAANLAMAQLKQPVKLKDWGTAHPQYECTGSNPRIKFSEDEDAYLLDLTEDMLQSDGTLPDRFSSQVLKIIKADPDATAIFHLRHIFNADRIRSRLRYHKLKL
jgi:hypothetical protein